MLAFSTCWNGHRHHDGEELVNEILLLGFEAMEISHGTKMTLFPGLKKAVDTGRIRVSGVHNFCPSPVDVMVDAPDIFEFTSNDESERNRAIKLTFDSISTAANFDADYVVLHLGASSLKKRTADLEKRAKAGQLNDRKFVQKKLEFIKAREAESEVILDRIRETLDLVLPYAEEKNVSLGIEIRSHFEQAPTERELQLILEEYPSPHLGYWHDFGHAQRKANLDLMDHAEVLARYAPRLIGAHLHDCGWPARDHRPPLSADIDYDPLVPHISADKPLVWEMSPRAKSKDIRKSIEDWKKYQSERNSQQN